MQVGEEVELRIPEGGTGGEKDVDVVILGKIKEVIEAEDAVVVEEHCAHSVWGNSQVRAGDLFIVDAARVKHHTLPHYARTVRRYKKSPTDIRTLDLREKD
jgi:hypothetical protein